MNENFKSITNWVFDLDETLYPPECGLLGQLKTRVRENLSKQFGVSFDDAHQLCEKYNKQYGAVFKGLKEHHTHEIDLSHLVEEAYDFDLSAISPNPKAKEIIKHLPGKKYIFTNSPALYACNVLNRLDLLHLFEQVFDVVKLGFETKPLPSLYETVFGNINANGENTIMIDDREENLKPAYDLGITTVLVNRPNSPNYVHVDYQYNTLEDFLQDVVNG